MGLGNTYKVYFESGDIRYGKMSYKHPRYKKFEAWNDIGLIKLEPGVHTNVGPVLSKLNIICLPHRDFKFEGHKMAVTAGIGYTQTMSIAPRRVHLIRHVKGEYTLYEENTFNAGQSCQVKIHRLFFRNKSKHL